MKETIQTRLVVTTLYGRVSTYDMPTLDKAEHYLADYEDDRLGRVAVIQQRTVTATTWEPI